MTCCKIYLTILALIMCHVNANYEHERLKSLSHLVDETSQVLPNNQADIYESASSKVLPHYNSYESNRDRFRDRFGNSYERLPINIKEKLAENKNLKKTKVPLLIKTNKDYIAKYKELIPDSEIAHCQEIKIKSIGKGDEIQRKDVTTCYKCENPKTKSIYKRCLYNSSPDESASASTKLEHFSSTFASPRYRRSNVDNEKIGYGKTQNPYRFTDEYFTAGTYNVPAAYESNGERCDKIVKNSMVCMICRDAKTNGKYEQCSYVKQPREKASSYPSIIKSGTFENLQERRNDSAQQLNDRSNSYSESSDFEESNLENKDSNPTVRVKAESHREFSYPYSYPNEDKHTERVSITGYDQDQEDKAQDASSAACKQVQKDSKTCTVCKDPKIGGTYEKCVYNYQPSDKLYKYSRSKSFGYPDKISSDSNSSRDSNKTPTSEKSKRFDYPQSSDSAHGYLDTDQSKLLVYPWRSDRIIESQQVANDYNSTSPNYSNDYSNFKESVINYQPTAMDKNKDGAESYKDEEATPSSKSVSEHYSENIDTHNCKKIQKDLMTCTVCKDPKTGNNFEQCSYSYQPSDKIFSYSKSSSFGNSREKDDNDKYQVPHEDEGEESSQDSFEIAKGSSYNDSPSTSGESYANDNDNDNGNDDDSDEDSDDEASTTEADEAKDADSKSTTEGKKGGVDVEYLNTAKKKAEIEEFMQNFQKKDRSKCRKIMRDKMTCYQCVDEEGAQKEECVFVTGQEPDQLAFHEIKEFQINSDSASHQPALKYPSSTKTRVAARAVDPLESSASASRTSYVKLEKPDNDYTDQHTQHTAEETKDEAEPYDYTSETRSVYNKVLGLTLPAYMFATSEHEAAFDELVASSHDQHDNL